ncbi:MAG: PQQ-dependent sugar dehydrogenase [Wenzhouxiangella sp.]
MAWSPSSPAHPLLGLDASNCENLDAIDPIAGLDFNADIQPLFQNCVGCHGQNGAAGLDLRPGEAYANLVNVASNSNFDRLRVKPFDPLDSTLFLAVNCAQPGGPGFQMPGMNSQESRAKVRDWINQGANETPFVPSIPDDVTLANVFPAGSFNGALGLSHAGDGSGRLFVVRQNGVIESFVAGSPATVFMNLSAPLSTGGERGLLGLAFHPEFASNGRFFLNYTAGSNHPSGAGLGDTVIAEYSVNPATGLGNPASERVLMTIAQDFANHNGGQIKFGPDGYLYIGMGDGGSGNDPCDRSQTLDPADRLIGPAPGNPGLTCKSSITTALLGKMLRIDVDSTTPAGSTGLCGARADGSAEYAIPANNPFVGEDACAEVWSWGLRNPWRFSFDRATGDQWIADVGQNTWEEVNREAAGNPGGDNYGWRVCEGSFVRGSTSQACSLANSVLPVLQYRTGVNNNRSITGGYRYRGPVVSLNGAYIYGDFQSGRIWFAWQTGPNEFSELPFSLEGFDLRSFGEDEAGNVYLIRSGGIWRFDGDVAPQPGLVAPAEGSVNGGTLITITGEGFESGAEVSLGAGACLEPVVNGPGEIRCTTPPGAPGSVDVIVSNPSGLSGILSDGFIYVTEPDQLFDDRFESQD